MMRPLAVLALTLAFVAPRGLAQDAPTTAPDTTGPTAEQLQSLTLPTLLAEARRLLDARDLMAAAPYIDAARQRDPASLQVKGLVAELALYAGDLTTARINYLDVHRANRDDYRANLGLGQIYLMTRNFSQASIYLRRAEALVPVDAPGDTAIVRRLLAQSQHGEKKYIEALETAEKARAVAPQDLDVLHTLIAALRAAGRTEAAVTEAAALQVVAEQNLRANPGDRQALVQLMEARRIHRETLSEGAAQYFELGRDGQRTDRVIPGKEADVAHVIREIAELQLRDAESQRLLTYYEVADLLARAVEYAPGNAGYWRFYGQLLAETFQRDAARQAFRKTLELDPTDEVAQRWLQRDAAADQARPPTAPAQE